MAKNESSLKRALDSAGPKPATISPNGGDNRDAKKNWAQVFSNALALTLADAIRPKYKNARVTPYSSGEGQEFTVGGKVDRKRTDVGIWDDAAGLVAGMSIKTYTFRDTHKPVGKPRYAGRYIRNVKRNDMELRDEADVLHRRQPYAVLTALFFMNEDACWDAGAEKGQSSFASAVFTLRKRTGRQAPESRFDLFEMVYIGLFEQVTGEVRFFDVVLQPPRNQPPSRDVTISLAQLIDTIDSAIVFRNTGVRRDERYAADDPDWSIPDGSLPSSLAKEEPVTLDDVIENSGEDDQEDETLFVYDDDDES